MNIIPVLLITFNRPEHTRRTIDALRIQRPPLVYVFQDGPRSNNSSDVTNCELVRKVIDECIDWPCELHTFFCEVNRGCRDAIIYAISEVLNRNEEVIVVEDDIITSPAFYSYMCHALNQYKSIKSVFSISGHSYSPSRFRVPSDYPYDVYASPRLFNWGWGTWRDRWFLTDWSFSYYDDFMKHPYEQQAFARGGEDLISMLREEHDGHSSAWDIQFAYAHFAHHSISIVPCISYTFNIGQDGSGTHCNEVRQPNIDVFQLNQNHNPIFVDNLYFDSRIINMQYSIFYAKQRPVWKKAINWVARRLGIKPPFFIKKKVFV